MKNRIRPCTFSAGLLLGSVALGLRLTASAAIVSVNIGDNFFSPSTVQINVNDRVRWAWIGSFLHSTTSTGGLWDSGLRNSGSFTNTFTTAGTFPYRCTAHAAQTGSVIVQAANTPPSVALTWPTNGTVFAAPWAATLQATASDPGGSVSQVAFYINNTLAGTVMNPGSTLSFSAGNFNAGAFTLKAVATDNQGATNTSASVAVNVVTPVPIQLTAPRRDSPGLFQFSYTATPGLRYIVERSLGLPVWSPIRTNAATASPVTFIDNNATASSSLYSVRLAPNP